MRTELPFRRLKTSMKHLLHGAKLHKRNGKKKYQAFQGLESPSTQLKYRSSKKRERFGIFVEDQMEMDLHGTPDTKKSIKLWDKKERRRNNNWLLGKRLNNVEDLMTRRMSINWERNRVKNGVFLHYFVRICKYYIFQVLNFAASPNLKPINL